jgi:hypothetical protein
MNNEYGVRTFVRSHHGAVFLCYRVVEQLPVKAVIHPPTIGSTARVDSRVLYDPQSLEAKLMVDPT